MNKPNFKILSFHVNPDHPIEYQIQVSAHSLTPEEIIPTRDYLKKLCFFFISIDSDSIQATSNRRYHDALESIDQLENDGWKW
jgi:hypothetical protein